MAQGEEEAGSTAEYFCVLNDIGLAKGHKSADLSLSTMIDSYEGINYYSGTGSYEVNYSNGLDSFEAISQSYGIKVQMTHSTTQVSAVANVFYAKCSRWNDLCGNLAQVLNETAILMRIEFEWNVAGIVQCIVNNSEVASFHQFDSGGGLSLSRKYNCSSYNWEGLDCKPLPTFDALLKYYEFATVVSYECSSAPNLDSEPVSMLNTAFGIWRIYLNAESSKIIEST